jgi:hypothetical protein
MYILLFTLFILLSPGFFLTIPTINGELFASNKTSLTAIIVHAALLGLIIHVLRIYYPMCMHKL